jgi:hypothetical protein
MPPHESQCQHQNFEALVRVNRLVDSGRFSADISIRCAECREPFRFLGADAGLSPYQPMASVDGLELRAPIEPQGTPKIASGARFEMAPLPQKTES